MNFIFIFRFVKFIIVGFSGLIIDFGITYLCKEILKINRYIANSAGFTVAASTNYILNRMWTFENSDPRIMQQYLYFFAISLVGLAFNNFIIWLLNGKLSADFSHFAVRILNSNKIDKEKLNFYSAKLIAIICVVIWNFFMNSIFTF
ncbi:MAG: GtrA family protein [Prevotellaceae bacterium]|nr:GtrA family protein [Prevotellaceae bacterium]